MRKQHVFMMLLLMAVAFGCFGQEFKSINGSVELNDGDTFVFLGDSITHQCLYTQYVEDYVYTRYPAKRIHFHNAGVGGDVADDALARFEDDLAVYKPKYVSVLLGMNDGRYTHFERPIFDTYEKNMTKLIDKLSAINAQSILIGPTMYDSWAGSFARNKPDEIRNVYYNGVMAFYGAWLREMAYLKGLGYVDMHGPLNHITVMQRQKNAKFTMIGDTVHPDQNGHVVMAMALLSDMNFPAEVSSIHVYQEGGIWQIKTTGGKAEGLEMGDSLSFTFTAEALPWVLPKEARLGYDLSGASAMSKELLKVNGLEAGMYDVLIGGKKIGQFSNVQLCSGIELQENAATPQYEQALKVALLNKERNDNAMHKLRDLWWQLKDRRHKLNDDTKDEFNTWYEGFKPAVAELIKKANEYEEKIYQANKPQALKYQIVKVQ